MNEEFKIQSYLNFWFYFSFDDCYLFLIGIIAFLKRIQTKKNCLGMNWKTDIMSDGAKKEKKRKNQVKSKL